MATLGKIASAVTVTMCVAALVVSIYPGWLNDILALGLMFGFLSLPAVLIVVVVIVAVQYRRGGLHIDRTPWLHVAAVLAMLFVTYVSLRFYIPRRIAFAWSRPSFEQLIDGHRQGNGHRELDLTVGLYTVDECLVDTRGGTYFRVYAGADGIGPNVMSYGFCYKPNAHGTPFGAAHYRTFRLGAGWYWFRASDDW